MMVKGMDGNVYHYGGSKVIENLSDNNQVSYSLLITDVDGSKNVVYETANEAACYELSDKLFSVYERGLNSYSIPTYWNEQGKIDSDLIVQYHINRGMKRIHEVGI